MLKLWNRVKKVEAKVKLEILSFKYLIKTQFNLTSLVQYIQKTLVAIRK